MLEKSEVAVGWSASGGIQVSSAVRALNTSVSEMEMSLRVVSGGVCKGTVGTELVEFLVNTE